MLPAIKTGDKQESDRATARMKARTGIRQWGVTTNYKAVQGNTVLGSEI